MGRTIASITQTWHEEEAALKRFERALRKEDQILLDELLVFSRLHLAEASYASNLYPLDMYLIAILLEVYKKLKSLEKEVHSSKKEQRPELVKETRFLEMLEESFRPILERNQEDEAIPVTSLASGLGCIPATIDLGKVAAETPQVLIQSGYTEARQEPSAWNDAKGCTAGAVEKKPRTEVHKGCNTQALTANFSQGSKPPYPPCALSDPATSLSYAKFEDAP